MKKTVLFLLMASGFAMLGTQASIAGNRPGAVTLTPEIDYYMFAQKRNLDNVAVLPAVRLAYNFDERWAIEAGYGHMHTRYNSSSNLTGSVYGNLYTVDGLYRFGKYQMLEPYVSAGAGVLYLNHNANSANNQANINVGLGTQLFLDDSVALRGEVRDLYMTANGRNDVMLSLGVSFLMGGETPHPSYKGEDFK
ncbi:MAG: OmpA family protein [Gammaproteobacteria bacterium]|nr:OmpA family protein [Gammaproteobacteria bacterium]